MAASSKPEFAPLLPPGRHRISIQGIRTLCLDRFTASLTRLVLFTELEHLANTISSKSISCDIWIDGSSLSEKDDPEDIDLIVKVDYDLLSDLDADANGLLDNIAQGAFSDKLDSYVLTSYPIGHPRRGTNLDRWPYWAQWWGVARGGWCKGVAVVRVGESGVGLRLVA